jgi:oxygen-independent coproporphyrinogen-3 oxidase
MYLKTQDICDSLGLSAYEVSNHARAGAECRHNLVYWRYGDYAGIGPGAHGRLTLNGTRMATDTPKAPALWLQMAERGHAELPREALPLEEQAVEFLLFGLRLSEGIDPDRYCALRGQPLPSGKIADLQELGLITQSNGRLAATREGRAVLNGVIRELMP